MNKDKMPLAEIRRILERGEWWDNVRDVSPDEPRPWLDEVNSAIEAALDKLQTYHDAEAEGRLLRLPVEIGQTLYCIRPGKNNSFYIAEWVVFSIRLDSESIFVFFREGFSASFNREYDGADWRNMYMSREEAEAALKEREARQ